MDDDTIFGHWHQPYRPPWWRIIKRLRMRRKRVFVPGTLTSYDEP